jgi:hypothetical protein
MTLRVLTGVIVPDDNRRTSGSAVISFNPHSVAGDANGVELDTAGGGGNFSNRPGKVVSLREIKVRDKDTLSGGSQNDFIRVHDNGLSTTQVEVEWSTTGGSEIRELSYLIVGDV